MGWPTSTTSNCSEAAIADVRALPGIRYAARDLTSLVAPPYDVIADAEVSRFEALSPHNVIRLTRPGSEYDRAARTLRSWMAEGVLREDGPSMYVHEVDFDGRTRRDLIAALRLEPYEQGVVLPHERTHEGPKEDRLALMRATRASLEPLWFLYDAAGQKVDIGRATPDLEFQDSAGLQQRLWVI